jgi:hypothetical protein
VGYSVAVADRSSSQDVLLPVVTVVTPSLNHGRFIRDTIESVLAQDYPRIEYLVQDGGSTDETIDVLRSYGPAVDWVSEPDRSQSHAITKGLQRGRGQIMTWLNSDDFMLPGAVTDAVSAFQADPGLGLVYGDGYTTGVEAQQRERLVLPEPSVWDLANLSCYIFQPSCFFRSDAFWSVGGLDESLRWVMDYDLFVRISMRYRTAHVAKPWSVQRVYDDCLTMSGGFPRFRELTSVVRRHSGRRYPPAYPFYLAETLATSLGRSLRRVPFPTTLLETATAAGRRRVTGALLRSERQVQGDGWVRRRCELWLPREHDAIEVIGEVPDVHRDLRLRLVVDENVVADDVLAPGPFQVVSLLPPSASNRPDRPVRVRFEADRSFIPSLRGMAKDYRSLSWRLVSVRLVDASEAVLPEPVGWYSDGWAGPRTRLAVRPGNARFEIRGDLPDEYGPIQGQTLTVVSGRRRLCRVDLAPGPFCLRVDPSTPRPFALLELAADRWFVPAEEGLGEDRRRLSYRLTELVQVS